VRWEKVFVARLLKESDPDKRGMWRKERAPDTGRTPNSERGNIARKLDVTWLTRASVRDMADSQTTYLANTIRKRQKLAIECSECNTPWYKIPPKCTMQRQTLVEPSITEMMYYHLVQNDSKNDDDQNNSEDE
jgi:hypothetical protein